MPTTPSGYFGRPLSGYARGMTNRARQGAGVALLGAIAYVIAMALASGANPAAGWELMLRLLALAGIVAVLAGLVMVGVSLVRNR